MSKSITTSIFAVIVAGVFLLFGATAHAAMPNFVGTGYYLPPCNAGDLNIREIVGGETQDTGCTPREALLAAQAQAQVLQETGVVLSAGESVTLSNGNTEVCPLWYRSGCVVDKGLLR